MGRDLGRAGFALAVVAAMAGCSGSGDSSPPTFAELDARGEALTDEILPEIEANGYTEPSTLPDSGSATYAGVIGIGTDGSAGVPAELLGEMTLTADFADATDPISGSATNFVTGDDEALSGSLALRDSVLDRGADPDLEPTYTAGLAGTLTDGSGLALDVSGEALGSFAGAGAEYTAAIVQGEVATAQGAAGFEGAFVGEQ